MKYYITRDTSIYIGKLLYYDVYDENNFDLYGNIQFGDWVFCDIVFSFECDSVEEARVVYESYVALIEGSLCPRYLKERMENDRFRSSTAPEDSSVF